MDYTQSFLKIAKTYPEFKEALEIVKGNSGGEIWLVGGFVYRSIIQDLYGIQMSKDVDFDFIVEKPKRIRFPNGWRLEKNSYGNPKFVGYSYEIDYIPLNNVYSIVSRNLEPTIENLLSGTPLNVQSVVFDVRTNKVIGDVGLKSIKDRVIEVNNLKQAKYEADRKGITVADLVNDTARQFGFTPVIPNT